MIFDKRNIYSIEKNWGGGASLSGSFVVEFLMLITLQQEIKKNEITLTLL